MKKNEALKILKEYVEKYSIKNLRLPSAKEVQKKLGVSNYAWRELGIKQKDVELLLSGTKRKQFEKLLETSIQNKFNKQYPLIMKKYAKKTGKFPMKQELVKELDIPEKDALRLIGSYNDLKNEFLKNNKGLIKNEQESKDLKLKKEVTKRIASYIKKNKSLPITKDVLGGGVTQDSIKRRLGGFTKFLESVLEENSKLEDIVLVEDMKRAAKRDKRDLENFENQFREELKEYGKFPSKSTVAKKIGISKERSHLLVPSYEGYIENFMNDNAKYIEKYLTNDKAKMEERRLSILDTYEKVLKTTKVLPTEHQVKIKGDHTRAEIASAFGKYSEIHNYARENRSELFDFLKTKDQIREEIAEDKRKSILDSYIELAQKIRRHPTIRELRDFSVPSRDVNIYFGGIDELKVYAIKHSRNELDNVHDFNDLVSDIRLARTRRNIKEGHRFVISSIGTGKVDEDYLKSIYNYCKRNKARLLLVPCQMKIDQIDTTLLDEYMAGRLDIIFEDTRICENLHINSIMIREKATNPASGITRYQKDNSSFIMASPKQTCKPVAVKKRGFPRLLISPGAITQPEYISNELLKEKADVMADNDHLIGASIVEVEGKYYFERRTQKGSDGSFVDFGVRYHTDGSYKIDNPEGFVMGDLHSSGKHDGCFQEWLDLIKSLKIEKTVLHDVFDAVSLNPHEKNQITKQITLAVEKQAFLKDEAKILVDDLKRVSEVTEKTYIVDSNHDDMLQRAFDSGLIWRDSHNAVLGSMLYPQSLIHNLKDDYTRDEIIGLVSEATDIDPEVIESDFLKGNEVQGILEYLCGIYGLDKKDNVEFLSLESSLMIGGFECGDHGHKGANGAKGSPASAAVSFVKRVNGHTHSEAQFNYVISVGHTSDDPKYARGGMSSWTRSSVIIYKTGEIQPVRYIDGRVRSTKDAFLPRGARYQDGIERKRLKLAKKSA